MEKFINWLNSIQAPVWIDPIRIAVGAFIVYKGIDFVNHYESFTRNIESVGWIFIAAHFAQAIIFIHLVCGVVLVLGAATRIMSLANIPILVGAVVFNYLKISTSDSYIELETTIGVLAFLILIFFYGAGKFSLDHRHQQAQSSNKTPE